MTKNFITDEPGMLTPINGEIELVTGKYDFYIFSISNAYLYPPTMENNLASNLVNGYDYLYCTLLEKNILATTTLNITLNHAASQIIFDIVSSDNSIIIDSVANAQITPPSNTGLTWNMFTGVITPSRALASSLLDLIVSDQMCHNIVLPLVSKDSLNLGFEIWLNNKTYYRDYNGSTERK